MARVDASLVRLTVAFNGVVEKGLEPKLPDDLRGDVIPTQVLQHEAALEGHAGSSASESGARGEAGEIYRKTERLLTRVRQGVLSSLEEEDDPPIDELGALGIGRNQAENQLRLANLAKTIAPHVAAGTIVLKPDLHPEQLVAHAARHAAINKEKGAATTGRQSGSKTLQEERDDTREMLKRVKAFLIAQKQSLVEFGFDLPAPPTRPRLARGEPTPAP